MAQANTVKKEKVVEIPEETAPTAHQPEGISLSDLSILKQIVDIATQRGAFKGSELSQVGGVYDKLEGFLTYVEEQQKTAEDALPEEVK
jgi:hypothetical protein